MSKTITLPATQWSAPLRRLRPQLRLLYSAEEGIVRNHVISLPTGSTWLGRALPPEHEGIERPNDVGLSAVHARIDVSTGDYRVLVQDQGSKNGTTIEGELIRKNEWYPFADGQILRAGNSFFLLRYELTQPEDVEIPFMIGVSPLIRELRVRIKRIATEPLRVLLSGETGTGKEVAAEALHRLSLRPGARISLNCSALPASLAESLLFGHQRGAFTGATVTQRGAFQEADQGTLFLDEIGDMPLDVQAKLLRALQEQIIQPLGSDQPKRVDTRVIAASNISLKGEINKGRFRTDLYARLAEIEINLPPLRDRREDLLLLLEHASQEATTKLNPDLVHALFQYSWPQNLRELFAYAHRLRIDGLTEEIWAQLLVSPRESSYALAHPASAVSLGTRLPRPYRLPVPPKEQLEELLREHCGNLSPVAEVLRCSRRQVDRWITRYGLNMDLFRTQGPLHI